jgi:hypothetical protein
MECGFGRSLPLAAMVLLALFGSSATLAHSSWPTHHSARSAVGMDADGLKVVVVIEVPTFELVADFRRHFSGLDLVEEIEGGRFEALEDQYRESRFERFAEDLEVRVDERSATGSWLPVETPVNGRGTEGFFVYMLEYVFEPQLPRARRRSVRVLNHVLPDVPMVLANQAQAEDGWTVVESSIPEPEVPDGLPRGSELVPELALWSEDPVKRDLRVTFAYATDDSSP